MRHQRLWIGCVKHIIELSEILNWNRCWLFLFLFMIFFVFIHLMTETDE